MFAYFWTNITLDFITCLLNNNDYNIILMIVNCLLKEKHYIPYTMDNNSIITEATAKLLLNYIGKLHGFLLSFILDKALKFISRV